METNLKPYLHETPCAYIIIQENSVTDICGWIHHGIFQDKENKRQFEENLYRF